MLIREAKQEDEKDIIEICYSSRSLKDFPNTDREVFALKWALYYLRYETDYCFVIEQDSKKIGYILATPNTKKFEKEYPKKIIPQIKKRLSPEHPDYQTSVYFERTSELFPELVKQYPAHLHINLTSACRGKGIGSKLMEKLEEKLKKAKIPGIHLGVMENNTPALNFYKKHGFEIKYRLFLGENIGYTLFMGKSLL